MRLPTFCAIALTAAIFATVEPPVSPAVAAPRGSHAFPPLWALQTSPAAVSAAVSELRREEAERAAVWAAAVAANEKAEEEARWYAAAAWNAAAQSAPQRPARGSAPSPSAGSRAAGTGRCGGDLPPCSVLACESGGSLTVYNHEGSGASGKWQITRPTWNGYGGYANAADAPEAVQDARAAQIYAGGAGRGNWAC